MMTKLEQIFVLVLMFGIICGLGVASTLLRAHAAADEGSGDSSSSDNSDSGSKSKDDGGSDNSGDSSSSNEESKEETKGTDESNSDKSDDSKVSESEDDRGVIGEENKPPINRDELKGTPEEQEKAAQEDHIADQKSDSELPKYVPKWKPSSENEFCANKIECDKLDHPGKHPVNNPYHPKYCDKWNHDCDSHPKCDNHGYTHQCRHDPKNHPEHHDWCSHHDCHHHHHHSNTHFSDNHHGDVTVKVHVTDYKSNDLSDVHLIIGDVYEKNLNLNSEPDQIKVDNLDIDGGDDFAVCLANEDSDEGDCVVTHADNDHDEVNVNLKVL